MLKCSKCKLEKEPINFTKNKNSSTGYRSECKICEKYQRLLVREILLNKKKQYREANKEKIKEYRRLYKQRKQNAKSTTT